MYLETVFIMKSNVRAGGAGGQVQSYYKNPQLRSEKSFADRRGSKFSLFVLRLRPGSQYYLPKRMDHLISYLHAAS